MYNYDDWAEKHADTIALILGGIYGMALLIFAVIAYIKIPKIP